MNNSYCPRIFHGLTLDNISRNSLSYSACCWATQKISNSNTIQFDHPKLIELRAINRDAQLPSDYCSRCISQEKTGQQSMRQGYCATHQEQTYNHTLQYLDINIDYTCNLACVTCGPELSTTWRNELKISGNDVRPNLDTFLETQLASLDFSALKEIRIWGGEPFLTNTHKMILNYIAENTNTDNISLMYNTNGTRRIDSATKQLIEKFKFARISFSVDALDQQFEYLRYPAKWDEVEQNLFWWKENLPSNSMLSLTVTASMLNVLDLDSVYDWHRQNFSCSTFGDPIEIYVHQAFGTYGLEYMPTKMIEYFKSMKNYCQPWLQQMDILGQRKQQLDQLLTALRTIDQRRGLNFSHVMPLTAELISYQK